MRLDLIKVMAAKLALLFSFLQEAESVLCPAVTISMNVATTSELQTLMTTINCTGEGAFNVTWIGSVSLSEAIKIRDEKHLTVTGSTSALTNFSIAAIDAGGTTGIFTVYNGSTLSLNNLVLEAGKATNGGAVDARSLSSVIVDDCVFTNNIATKGGEARKEKKKMTGSSTTREVHTLAGMCQLRAHLHHTGPLGEYLEP